MINYPASLKAVGGARTGIAPVNLLDVLTLNNDLYLFSDRLMTGVPSAVVATEAIPATPPVLPVPAGQAVAWSLPTDTASIRVVGGLPPFAQITGLTVSGGHFTQFKSSPFASVEVSAQWIDFTMPALPAGATITAIYPVIICAATGADTQMLSGLDSAVDVSSVFSGGVLQHLNGVDGQISGPSIGSTLSALEHAVIGVRIYCSLALDPNLEVIDVSFVGLAVYYTLPSEGSPGEPEIPGSGIPPAEYLPWLMSVPQISFHRSLQTDFGSFVLQNVSGDTLSRDFEKLMRRATLEGAFFIYRLWQADAEASWLEVHGTLTVEDVGVDTVKLKGVQLLNPAQEDTPPFQYSETCQLQWAGRRCGATGSTECKYSYQTCQVPERIFAILNNFEKNYGESLANVAIKTINRRRKI